ncbi:MAG: thiamine pyrophosphate-binding protein [Thermomicrobiales bacterium]
MVAMIASSLIDVIAERGTATGAELAIATLEANGVEVIFGIPGVHTLALYDALGRSRIRHVLARHEQGAGFMADGYARASGHPGVALVITGPGVTNIATAVGEAYTDSSPVFVLSSNVHRPWVDGMRGSLHDLKDQLAVMRAVTQWNTRVDRASDVAGAVSHGFARLSAGRSLPVHVEIPVDVLDEPALDVKISEPSRDRRLLPDPVLLRQAADRLKTAPKTVIYCGGGAVQAAAGEHVLALADRLGAPVVTSIMGKGSVPEDHPLVLGNLWSPENAVDELLQEADCLLVVGSKLGAQATSDFQMRFPHELIRIDVDPRELTLNARPTLSILGDAALAVEDIASLLAGEQVWRSGFDVETIATARKRAQAGAFGAHRRDYVDALRRAIPRGGIASFDMTMMSYVACGLYPVYEPRTFMFPSGFGTLGFSLPIAIGAKVARPDAAVVCIVGDGGFQFTMAELATAIQFHLGIPIVIFNDSTYSAVKEAQVRERDGRSMAVDLVNPDYVDLARAYGVPAERPDSPQTLEDAIVRALDRDVPTIIDVPIDPWVT